MAKSVRQTIHTHKRLIYGKINAYNKKGSAIDQ